MTMRSHAPIFLIALTFLFSTALARTVPAEAPAPAETKTKKLIVLGDSLTEGYGVARESAFPAVLEKRIHEGGKKEWSVVNAGVSGSTTASAVSRMKWVFRTKPDMVILCLGANDGLRGIKVAESKKNLDAALDYAKSLGVPVVLGGLYMPPNYGKEYTSEFHKMYEDLAKKHKVVFIPFLLEGVGGKSQYNLADGIHPNEKGHELIAKTVYDAIKGTL